eukprot:5442494-Pyramimonas_sp.AAC.1
MNSAPPLHAWPRARYVHRNETNRKTRNRSPCHAAGRAPPKDYERGRHDPPPRRQICPRKTKRQP